MEITRVFDILELYKTTYKKSQYDKIRKIYRY